jgi:hypothetical protein
MDAVVIGSILCVVVSIVVIVAFGYKAMKGMNGENPDD